ncbi:hypothetical protein GCM10007036_14680 [Alsobacter metallidurans]|uniref:Copper chaperone PCu(A)C n=1 Tax=Alsobacter metallidurans TaxID=340221 RepID=A0A917I607_9HYPH|nr:copper chaperone PCu(A)C [Alsobacter metallidurans]GGH15000.1 hypothetical protein GCM10007036_14680 [Alsobacter metallidurans]
MRGLFLAGAFLLAAPALAHDFQAGELVIVHPTSRATPGGAKVGAGYLTIRNTTSSDDRLVRIESAVADRIQVHASTNENGVARMREMANGLPLPANSEVTLKAGGDHIMFVDLKQPLKAGDKIAATLVFEHAGQVEVTFNVEPLGGAKAGASEHAH